MELIPIYHRIIKSLRHAIPLGGLTKDLVLSITLSEKKKAKI
jgi:hypothetical protein